MEQKVTPQNIRGLGNICDNFSEKEIEDLEGNGEEVKIFVYQNSGNIVKIKGEMEKEEETYSNFSFNVKDEEDEEEEKEKIKFVLEIDFVENSTNKSNIIMKIHSEKDGELIKGYKINSSIENSDQESKIIEEIQDLTEEEISRKISSTIKKNGNTIEKEENMSMVQDEGELEIIYTNKIEISD